MTIVVPQGRFTAAQALAWIMFRDASKGNFEDVVGSVRVMVEIPSTPPKPSKEERRLGIRSRSRPLSDKERYAAFLASQELRVARLATAPQYLVDPATGEPAVELRPRGASVLYVLATAYGIADEARRFLTLAEATNALRGACANGTVAVTGLKNGKGDRAAIEPSWWSDARLCDGSAPYSIDARGSGPEASEWHALLFDRAAVEREWPRASAAEKHASRPSDEPGADIDAEAAPVLTEPRAVEQSQSTDSGTRIKSTMSPCDMGAWLTARHARLGGDPVPPQTALRKECEADNPEKHVPRERFRKAVRQSDLYVKSSGVRR